MNGTVNLRRARDKPRWARLCGPVTVPTARLVQPPAEVALSQAGFFAINGRPVRVASDGDVRAMDPVTGAMVPDGACAERVAAMGPGVVELSQQDYRRRLDALRQPLLERYASAALRWDLADDDELSYCAAVDGHELAIRTGDFPDEPMYLLYVDGQELYTLDDWPSQWLKPSGPVVQNLCSHSGWLVDGRELPTDPVEHDAEVLPRLGCSNLRCSRCGAEVRSVAGRSSASPGGIADAAALYQTEDLAGSPLLKPTPTFRTYTCRCTAHVETHERRLDGEDEQIWTPWSCAGHPLATLPHAFDGVEVTAEDLERLVVDSLAGWVPAGAREADRGDGVWAARLCSRLARTPHARRIAKVVAARLTHSELVTRVRALKFFANVPSRAYAMEPHVLLGQHAELFVGVPLPYSSATATTLEHVLWRSAGSQLPRNPAFHELARSFALDPRRASRALFTALATHDPRWIAQNAKRLAAANPALTRELRDAAITGAFGSDVAQALRRVVGGGR